MKLRFETDFLRVALEQEAPVRKGLGKLLRLAESLSFAELLHPKGAHLEKLVGHTDPFTGQPLYPLRITAIARASPAGRRHPRPPAGGSRSREGVPVIGGARQNGGLIRA